MPPIKFSQNNLKKAASPYLLQHKDNPVWWQEWNKEVLEYARAKKKIIFASIGYATCHWCHMMTQEAFSNQEIADYLNAHFISIKIDREQRPDIDQYAMTFLSALTGQGGWPLNIFFTPALRPIHALTYAPVEKRYGMLSFLDILIKIKTFYDQQKGRVEPFVPKKNESSEIEEERIIPILWNNFDRKYGGFGTQAKFPPHSTLLFMLYFFEVTKDEKLKEIITKTLDAVRLKGLCDHLQGGFFRYSVDRAWIIPHFEKMLYDQALLLWEYSLAYRLLEKKEYKSVAKKIMQCLEETFEHDGVYYSGHDADTDHHEGATYLWTQEDLCEILTSQELARFKEVYDITEKGNFESKNHLVKKEDVALEEIENKLLEARRKRHQPFIDRKVITSWNCLVGIGFIQAHKYLGDKKALAKAETLFQRLKKLNCRGSNIFHSSFDTIIQNGEFLQDYAATLLFLTYLHEETGRYEAEMNKLYGKLKEYREEEGWVESFNEDFIKVPAENFDSSIPSSASLAELAVLRTDMLHKREYNRVGFEVPLAKDFFNISALIRNRDRSVVE